jgi:DNA-directed RNA polymerase specialized sigma24 family protein
METTMKLLRLGELFPEEYPRDTAIYVQESVFNAVLKFKRDDERQRKEYQRHYCNDSIESLVDTYNLETDVLSKAEFRATQIRKFSKYLSDSERFRMRLHFCEDRTHSEIATIENCSVQAVRNSIKRGLKKLMLYQDEIHQLSRECSNWVVILLEDSH